MSAGRMRCTRSSLSDPLMSKGRAGQDTLWLYRLDSPRACMTALLRSQAVAIRAGTVSHSVDVVESQSKPTGRVLAPDTLCRSARFEELVWGPLVDASQERYAGCTDVGVARVCTSSPPDASPRSTRGRFEIPHSHR